MLQLIHALTGVDEFPPILDGLLTQYIIRLKAELEDLIWGAHLIGDPLAQQLLQSYERLSEHLRICFFLSPQGSSAILAARRAREPARLEELAGALTLHATGQLIAINAGAPTLGQKIAVDLDSAWCRRIIRGSVAFSSPYEAHTPDEQRVVVTKLQAAFKEISATAPTFARLICNYTREVFVRKASGMLPSSEQEATEMGGIRLRNVHLDSYDHGQLVDDLIHESIHNFLSVFEYVYFSFVRYIDDKDHGSRAVSPWSGRSIQVEAFVHAVFVYFGMLNYVCSKLESTSLPPFEKHDLLQRRGRYASGFLMPGRLSNYVAQFASVDPRAIKAIDSMEKSVIQRFGLTRPAPDERDQVTEAVASIT